MRRRRHSPPRAQLSLLRSAAPALMALATLAGCPDDRAKDGPPADENAAAGDSSDEGAQGGGVLRDDWPSVRTALEEGKLGEAERGAMEIRKTRPDHREATELLKAIIKRSQPAEVPAPEGALEEGDTLVIARTIEVQQPGGGVDVPAGTLAEVRSVKERHVEIALSPDQAKGEAGQEVTGWAPKAVVLPWTEERSPTDIQGWMAPLKKAVDEKDYKEAVAIASWIERLRFRELPPEQKEAINERRAAEAAAAEAKPGPGEH